MHCPTDLAQGFQCTAQLNGDQFIAMMLLSCNEGLPQTG